jgi:protein-L-isoaspartate O-methyltransferase
MIMPHLILTGSLILGITLATILIKTGHAVSRAIPIIDGPVFFPSSDNQVTVMLKLATVNTGEKVIDLGSGDGKILFSLAKQGIPAVGVEINPYLVWRSRRLASQLKVKPLVKIKRQSFWKLNLANYDVVFLYGIPHIMDRLEKKLLAELKPGSRVISNRFQFPNWRPEITQQQVWVYVKE